MKRNEIKKEVFARNTITDDHYKINVVKEYSPNKYVVALTCVEDTKGYIVYVNGDDEFFAEYELEGETK